MKQFPCFVDPDYFVVQVMKNKRRYEVGLEKLAFASSQVRWDHIELVVEVSENNYKGKVKTIADNFTNSTDITLHGELALCLNWPGLYFTLLFHELIPHCHSKVLEICRNMFSWGVNYLQSLTVHYLQKHFCYICVTAQRRKNVCVLVCRWLICRKNWKSYNLSWWKLLLKMTEWWR